MQEKLPLDNLLFKALSSLDPYARGHSKSHSALKQLKFLFPTVLTPEEAETYDLEVNAFSVADNLLRELLGLMNGGWLS